MLTRPDWRLLSPEQRREALKPLLRDGKSASEIAAMFVGCTRNALIAFCFRKKMSLPNARLSSKIVMTPKPVKPRATRQQRRPKTAEIFESAPLPPVLPAPDPALAVPFVDAISSRTACKWPLWDQFSADAMCCGTPRGEGQPYCTYHARISVGRGTEGERRAERELEKHG
jgi:GcrA cell cycle regulator